MPWVRETTTDEITGNRSNNEVKNHGYSDLNDSGSHSINSHGTNGTNGHAVKGENVSGKESTHTTHEKSDIAICGMALRLPGGLRTPQQFWDFLLNGRDGRIRVPESRYNISAFYDTSGKPTTIPTEYGYFLDEDLGALDTSFFSMPRIEVEQASPEHRLMLEVARECLEDAGEVQWRGKNIGCFMGSFGEDWAEMAVRDTQAYGNYRLQGPADFVLSNRISYEMDFRGPSTTTRTACSASMTALNEACLSVSRGDCEAALVGGTNLIITPTLTSTLADQGVLAKDGCCKTFSADADGYARGEAIVAIFVKKLSDAIKDGNSIRSVIRATAINSDGKTPSFSQPSADAHETLMRRAYAVAGITDYSKTGFVECHGTGTRTGDPIEVKAVARVFGHAGVYITSVKPNVGHTEGASGLVSVIKAVLALQNRIIPPNIRLGKLNPSIPFKDAKLTVPLEPTPWPRDRLERVSINSFGAGGANAHVILDSAASFNIDACPTQLSNTHHLLLFSTTTPQALRRLTQNYQEYIEANPEKVEDISYTLANRREHLPLRAFAVAHRGILGQPSIAVKAAASPSLVMVFTGQGAQWPLMGRDLLRSNQTFRITIRKLDAHLRNAVDNAPEWTIENELCKTGKKSRIHTAEFAQPLCTAVQIALVDCLAEIGIRPQAVVGHSSGEIAAAYSAGSLTAEEAILVAFYRGVVGRLATRNGAMAAIGMGWDDVKQHLIPGVDAACDNSPNSVTISGDTDKVEFVISELQNSRPEILARKLQVDKAYHSHHMLEWSDYYENLISNDVFGRASTIPFFSSVTGEPFDSSDSPGPWYWGKNMKSPVRFRTAVSNILHHDIIGKNPLFLEIGPHSALAGPLRQILSHESKSAPYFSTMQRNQNTVESFLTAAGNLYTRHVPINIKALSPTGKCLSDLPRYPWNHEESFWSESRMSRDYRLRQHPHQDLLGIRTLESSSTEPSWRNLLHLNTVPWVRDHRVGEDIVFPMAGYLAIAGEAARQISGIEEAFTIKRFVMTTALVLTEGRPTEMVTNFKRHTLTDVQNSAWWEFTISSYNGSNWKKHCSGQVMAHSKSREARPAVPTLPKQIDAKAFYHMRTGGVFLGPAFRNLRDITGHTKTHRTTATVVNGKHADAHKYYIHPCSIDTIIQLAIYNQYHGYTRVQQTWLPVGVEDFEICRYSSDFAVDCWLRLKDGYIPFNEAHAVANGTTIARMSGLKLALDYDTDTIGAVDTHAAARLEWSPDIDFLPPTTRDLLTNGNGANLQESTTSHELEPFLRSLAHSNPNIRVLEIESSTSSLSKRILQYLSRAEGQVLCSKYTFATCNAIPPENRELLFEKMTYETLDTRKDPSQQGFEEEQYDLIILNAVLLDVQSVTCSMKNIKSVLQPNGYLIVQGNIDAPMDLPNLTKGLHAAGFQGSQATVFYSYGLSHSESLATIHNPEHHDDTAEIHILCHEPANLSLPLLQELEKAGYKAAKCTLEDVVPCGQDVVALLDLEGPFFEEMSSLKFTAMKEFLHRLEKSGIFWVTYHSQINVSDPRYAQVVGFARTMRSEMLLDFAVCEVDDIHANAASIVKVFDKFRNRSSNERLAPEMEYAICDGVINIGRFYPFVLKKELLCRTEATRAVLAVEIPGRLNTMKWVGQPDHEAIGDNEVKIELSAVGVNFRDVLSALKIMEIVPFFFGWEGAGIVQRVGPKVHHLQPGDRVAAIGPDMLATSVTIDACRVVKIPENLGFEEASVMFFPYLTAMYSLQTVGGLEKGQSVLIHSACGGVGLAALELSRMLEFEIYVTVGSEDKVQFLKQRYNIPPNRIFNSRDSSFVEGVMRETQGMGVDLVLNSLAGDLLHASWRCVAQFGKFIELGKRDLVGHGKLDMDVFLGNRSYCSVDIGFLPFVKKSLLARLMASIADIFGEGKLPALTPLKVFSADSAQEAFRFMRPGQHIGRICLSLRENRNGPLKATITPAPRILSLDSTASYLLIGGLGGLGRAISSWMVEHGARHLIYLSRNAGRGANDKSFEAELNSMGCNVQFICGSVTNAEDVQRAITESPLPLNGILQMSAVFRDENFSKMSIDQWNEASSPKVQGTWNLHAAVASRAIHLDFFVLFSSLSGTVGQPGQANYASANTFLDAFVQYRRNMGLAASAIDIGAVDGIGYISQNGGMMQTMRGLGFKLVKEPELLDALMLAMAPEDTSRKNLGTQMNELGDPHTFTLGLGSTTPLNDPANRAIWKRDRRMAIYHNMATSSTAIPTSALSLTAYISNARTDLCILKRPESHNIFATEIGKRIFQLLLKPEEDLDTTRSFADLGVDSLLAIELKQWWRQVFGFDISVLELLNTGSLEALGKFASEGLLKEMST